MRALTEKTENYSLPRYLWLELHCQTQLIHSENKTTGYHANTNKKENSFLRKRHVLYNNKRIKFNRKCHN